MDSSKDLAFVVVGCRSLKQVAPFGRYQHIGEYFFQVQAKTILLDAVAISEEEFVRLSGCTAQCSQSADGKSFRHTCDANALVVGCKVR